MEEGRRIHWIKDFKDGASRQEEKRKTTKKYMDVVQEDSMDGCDGTLWIWIG